MLNNLKRFLWYLPLFVVLAESATLKIEKGPQNYQLLARGANDSAVIVVSGFIKTDSVATLLSARYRRNGVEIWKTDTIVPANNDSFSFNYEVGIFAEKASYSFAIYADSSQLFLADSIVCGDVILVNGQSNALACSGGNPPETSEWFRSFGSMDYDAPWGADTIWCRAHSREPLILGTVGDFGLRLGLRLVEEYPVPLCIINGAVSGSVIDEHFPDPVNRENLETIYGRLLNRCKRAGVANGVRSIIWHQGEHHTDSAYMRWGEMWDTLREEWRRDFPSIDLIVVCQTRHGCGQNHQDMIRDAQRRLFERHPEVRLITTSDFPEHDGCHYGTNGYFALGDRLFRVYAANYHSAVFPYSVTAPRLQRAFFATNKRQNIFLEFDQPVVWQGEYMSRMLEEFFFFADTSVRVTGGSVSGNSVRLNLNKPYADSEITYTPNIYYPKTYTIFNGPYIRNGEGQTALTFLRQQIEPPPDTVPIVAIRGLVRRTVEQYEKAVDILAVERENYVEERDTISSGFVVDIADTFIAVVDSLYGVYGCNTGNARVAFTFGGLSDTAIVKIVPTTASLDSLRIMLPRHWLLSGDTVPAKLTAYYRSAEKSFNAPVDTSAFWFVSNPLFGSVKRGVVASSKLVTGQLGITAGLNSVAVTEWLDILPCPAFIRRIRFAGSSIPPGSRWYSDSGHAFSADKGMGWLDSSHYRIIVPSGNYVVRIALLPLAEDSLTVMIGSDTVPVIRNEGKLVVTRSVSIAAFEDIFIQTEHKLDYIVIASLPLEIDMKYIAEDNYVHQEQHTRTETLMESGEPGLSFSPNPANPNTRIIWRLPQKNLASAIIITTLSGCLVRSWDVARENRLSGEVVWDGKNGSDKLMASGVYLIRLESGKNRYIKKIVILH